MNKYFSITLSLLLIFPLITNGETVIHNSVSVSSSGGVSTTQVKTVSNGVVIEDTKISSSTPYHYQSTYGSNTGLKTEISNTDTTNTDKLAMINQLLDLLNELQMLMEKYEKLQTK